MPLLRAPASPTGGRWLDSGRLRGRPHAVRRRWLATLGAVAVVLGLLLPIAAWPHGPGPGPTRPVAPGDVGGPEPGSFPTPIHHVFVVMLENARRSTVLANGPFERYLASRYASADHYYAVCHPSAPNYLALTSGEAWQCGSDGYTTHASENVGDLAERAGLSWDGFEESMPTACNTTDTYPYAVKHNPLVYYPDVVGNATRCDAHDLPWSAWNSDVANGSIPAFALFTPNLTNDGHDTGVAHADAWLDGWLSPLLNASWFASSVFFVVYDESVNDSSGYAGLAGGNVYFSAVSPFARAGSLLTSNVSHYNLLGTIEWLLGLGNCSHHDGTSQFPPLAGLFAFPSGGNGTTYALSGTVTVAGTGAAITGASVNLTGHGTVTTGATGQFLFDVPNGTYTLSVSAAGFEALVLPVVVNGTPEVVNVSLGRSPAPPRFAVLGNVRDLASGEGIGGATVGPVGGNATATDAAGNFSLEETNGTYVLTAQATGYRTGSATATVRGGPVNVSIVLARAVNATYAIDGFVRSAASQAPIDEAQVGPFGAPTVATNASGAYELAADNGSWVIHAAAKGYVGANTTVRIDGRPTFLNFSLAPAPNATGPPLAVRATVPTLSGVVGQELEFTAHPSGGVPPYIEAWTFGDGAGANGSNVSHAYRTAGTFQVNVTARDAAGTVERSSLNLSIAPAAGLPGGSTQATPGGSPLLPWAAAGAFASAAIGVVAWRWRGLRAARGRR